MTLHLPDRFELLEVLTDSATERVVRARDSLLARDVVIKAHAPGVMTSRALREARALARIDRPDVTRLIDVLDAGETPLLVMEGASGHTLADRLARERCLSADETIEIGRALAEALAAVHRAGLVHRNVSPATVELRPRGGICLTGFTFVKETTLGAAGTSLGFGSASPDGGEPAAVLPRYPAPEQWLGQSADARADVFALGCVLYESLMGSAPFPPVEKRTDNGSAATPSLKDTAHPLALRRLIEQCMSTSPARRPADGAEVAERLAEAAAQPAVAMSPAPSSSRTWIAAAALVLVAGLSFVMLDASDEPVSPFTSHRGARLRDPSDTASALSVSYARSHALVIGIGDAYSRAGFPRLPNAERDGDVVAETLEGMDWENWNVRSLLGEEATRENIMRELDALEAVAEVDDRVLVFYAGHGEAHERSPYGGYLIPADARPIENDPGRSSWISFGRLQDIFDQCAAKHILLCIDSCYSGRVTSARSASASGRAQTYLSQQAHLVLTSGRPFEQVSDGEPGQHSPFTRALLESLRRDEEPFITTADMFVHMQNVFDAAGVPHAPSLGHASRSTFGQVVFFPRAP